MLYPEGLMHRKVNIGLALIIIFIIAGIFAWIISARAVFVSTAPGIGVIIFSPPMKCVSDPDASTCLFSCPICGSLAGVCNGIFEIQAQFLSGINTLYQGLAFCTAPPVPTNGGSFTPGAQCLGNVWGTGPHLLVNFGCSVPTGFF